MLHLMSTSKIKTINWMVNYFFYSGRILSRKDLQLNRQLDEYRGIKYQISLEFAHKHISISDATFDYIEIHFLWDGLLSSVTLITFVLYFFFCHRKKM